MSSTAYIKEQRLILFGEQKRKCWFCGRFSWNPASSTKFDTKRPDTMFTVDHILPKSCGGRDNSFNFVGACRACNHKRAAPLRLAMSKTSRGDDRRREAVKMLAPMFHDDRRTINIKRNKEMY